MNNRTCISVWVGVIIVSQVFNYFTYSKLKTANKELSVRIDEVQKTADHADELWGDKVIGGSYGYNPDGTLKSKMYYEYSSAKEIENRFKRLEDYLKIELVTTPEQTKYRSKI